MTKEEMARILTRLRQATDNLENAEMAAYELDRVLSVKIETVLSALDIIVSDLAKELER